MAIKKAGTEFFILSIKALGQFRQMRIYQSGKKILKESDI